MEARWGIQNGAKSPLGDFGTRLGRPRCRKRRFENGSEIGPEKRRLLDQVAGLSGAGLAECAGALGFVLGRFRARSCKKSHTLGPYGGGGFNRFAHSARPGRGITKSLTFIEASSLKHIQLQKVGRQFNKSWYVGVLEAQPFSKTSLVSHNGVPQRTVCQPRGSQKGALVTQGGPNNQ